MVFECNNTFEEHCVLLEICRIVLPQNSLNLKSNFFSSSYRKAAERISKSIKRLPRPPIKEAADWVEYTQAQGGLQYLRPRGLDLPFYQLYLLDILFLAFSVLGVSFLIITFLLKAIMKCLLGSSKKEKTN